MPASCARAPRPRLTQQLREGKGYTYGIRSGFSGGMRHGTFEISSGVRSNVTLEAAELVKSILADFGTTLTQADLEVSRSAPEGLLYRCETGSFAIFQSSGTAAGTHTQMGWEVTDLAATVAALRARGVIFEEYDLPGLRTRDGIALIQGNYPSKGTGEYGAWFRDSEGNLLGIGQPIP